MSSVNHQFRLAALRGNFRVGLEDSFWMGPGKLAKSNAEQVGRAQIVGKAAIV